LRGKGERRGGVLATKNIPSTQGERSPLTVGKKPFLRKKEQELAKSLILSREISCHGKEKSQLMCLTGKRWLNIKR